MAKETLSVTEAFYKARMTQQKNLINSFSNGNSVANDDDNSEEEEEDVEEEAEDEEDDDDIEEGGCVSKAEDIFLYKALDDELVTLEEDEDGITKAIYTDTDFNRNLGIVGQEFDFQKSDIMNAISGYSDNKITIQKSGKEIKEQIKNVVLPAKEIALADKKRDATDILEDCGDAPTKDVPCYWTSDMHIEVPFKFYDWEETCCSCKEDSVAYSLSPNQHAENEDRINRPETQAECNARREYNDAVHAICEILVDIKACKVLLNNLSDSVKVELTPRQIVVLNFD